LVAYSDVTELNEVVYGGLYTNGAEKREGAQRGTGGNGTFKRTGQSLRTRLVTGWNGSNQGIVGTQGRNRALGSQGLIIMPWMGSSRVVTHLSAANGDDVTGRGGLIALGHTVPGEAPQIAVRPKKGLT